jgi:hypothetical protein
VGIVAPLVVCQREGNSRREKETAGERRKQQEREGNSRREKETAGEKRKQQERDRQLGLKWEHCA